MKDKSEQVLQNNFRNKLFKTHFMYSKIKLSGTSFFCNAFSLFSSSFVTFSSTSSSLAAVMMAVAAGNYDAVNVDIQSFSLICGNSNDEVQKAKAHKS